MMRRNGARYSPSTAGKLWDTWSNGAVLPYQLWSKVAGYSRRLAGAVTGPPRRLWSSADTFERKCAVISFFGTAGIWGVCPVLTAAYSFWQIRHGGCAYSVDFHLLEKRSGLVPEFVEDLDKEHPLQILVGTKGAGKSTSASKMGVLRQNSLWIDVSGKPTVDTPKAVMELMYDGMLEHQSIPAVPLLPQHKRILMGVVLWLATVKGKTPTVIFDVHRGCTSDAADLMGSIKILQQDHHKIRAIVTATEGKAYAKVASGDKRWKQFFETEISTQVAQDYMEKCYAETKKDTTKEEMLLLMKKTPLLPLALTGGKSHMQLYAQSNADAFIAAFGLNCTNADRKKFAEQALNGFIDPQATALMEILDSKKGVEDKEKVDKWFHDRFVKTNVMANYTGEYEFQFAATRRIAEMLTEEEVNGDIVKLKAKLKDEKWL